MFVLLTSICQYISEIVLFCWVQNYDSSASEYQTTEFSPFMVCDCVCNQLPKLPNFPPPSHKTYNMPSDCTISPGMSGCMMLTCTVLFTIAFPGCLPYERETYTRHMLPYEEEEYMQDSHMYIMDLEDPHDYPPSALHDIHEATPMDNPGCLPYERQAYTQDNLAASLMEGRHTQDRYPNRSSLPERQHIQTNFNPHDSFLDDSSPDSYLLLNDSFTWLTCFLMTHFASLWLILLLMTHSPRSWLIHLLMAYWSLTHCLLIHYSLLTDPLLMLTDSLLYAYSFTYISTTRHVFKEDTSDGWNLRSVLVTFL